MVLTPLQATPSILSLPPLPPDTEPLYQSVSAVYMDALTHPIFFQCFPTGICIWYACDLLGCFIYDRWVPLQPKNHLQREQFAGHFISFIHALMIGIMSLTMLITYTPFTAVSADPNSLMIKMYKCAATFSAAYFFMDAIFISIYYKQSKLKTFAFVLHHFLSGVCIISCIVTGTFMTYVYALFFVIEWSTVILDIRIFAKIWQHERIYFVSGIALLISYPLSRIIWNSYLVVMAFSTEYLVAYSAPGGEYVTGISAMFVAILSAYYYFFIILRRPKKIYILHSGNAHKKEGKNC